MMVVKCGYQIIPRRVFFGSNWPHEYLQTFRLVLVVNIRHNVDDIFDDKFLNASDRSLLNMVVSLLA